ncbi:MAG: PEP-utilizing enzyme, partial [Bacillota bacterium]
NDAVDVALEKGLVKNGDLVTITAGVPVGTPGTTNLIKVDIVGDPLVEGQGIGRGIVSGNVKIVHDADEALSKIEKGDILVTHMTNEQYAEALKKVGAIVTAEGGLSSHAAVTGLELDIPVIVNAGNIMELVADGDPVTVDGVRGQIFPGYVKIQ